MSNDHRKKFAGLLELVRAAKEKKIDVLVVAHPEVLGDDYDELVLNLNLVSEAELLLSIVPPKQRGG